MWVLYRYGVEHYGSVAQFQRALVRHGVDIGVSAIDMALTRHSTAMRDIVYVAIIDLLFNGDANVALGMIRSQVADNKGKCGN